MLAKATFTTATEQNPLKRLLSQVESADFLETRTIEYVIEAREIRDSDPARYEELMIEATRCITKARIAVDRAQAGLKKKVAAEYEKINEAAAIVPEPAPEPPPEPLPEVAPAALKRSFLRETDYKDQ